jgi:hypothetical protein
MKSFPCSVIALAALALALAACAPKSSTPAPSSPPAPNEPMAEHEIAEHEAHADGSHGAEHAAHADGTHPAEHEGHSEGAPGSPLGEFHEHLAPLWHAPESPERVANTCAAAGTLHDLAGHVVAAGAPAGAAADYLDAAKHLVDAVAALQTECATPARKDFATRFAAVHQAFHGVAERASH